MKVHDVLVEKVSPQDLVTKLDEEVTLTYSVGVKLTGGKKNEQQGRITKTVKDMPVLLVGPGTYQRVRRESGDEEFEAKARKWGIRNEQGLIEHNGQLYVEYIAKGRGQVQFMLDGQPIDKSQVVGLPPTTTQSDINTGVILRALNIESIIAIR